jgi:hypothetical protein
MKTNAEFAEYLVEYIQKHTNEAEKWDQRLIDITQELFDIEEKTISPDEKLEIFNEVNEILWEQA